MAPSSTPAKNTARFEQPSAAGDPEKGNAIHQENASLRSEAGDSQALAHTESQPGSSRYASSTTGLDHRKELSKAEKKLTWKLDVIIVPVSIIMYLSAYLDRGNLGNARLQGLERDILGGDDKKFSLALACFYITYIVFAVPGTLLAKQILPSTSIACGCLIWSIAATCQAGAFGPAGLYVCRLFVGVGESMFGQAMAFYLCLFYTKSQLSKRIGLYVAAGALAGAFGGLIAYGVAHIENPKIPQWRILFLIEGLPGVLLAIFVYFCMPTRPERTRYLSEDERTLACTRLNADNQHEDFVGIDWRSVRRTLTDPKAYLCGIQYSCLNICLASVSGFLPTIVKNLGYSAADAQLFTVPPYAVCVVFMYCITSYSDKFQTRGIPIACVYTIGMIGWVLLHTIDAQHGSQQVRYFACFCIVAASYSAAPMIMGWTVSNSATESSRAAALGLLNLIGQPLSIAGSYIFPSNEGPQYDKGTSINIAFQILGIVTALVLTTYYRRENKRRDSAEGGRPPKGQHLDLAEKFDLSPGFRYVV